MKQFLLKFVKSFTSKLSGHGMDYRESHPAIAITPNLHILQQQRLRSSDTATISPRSKHSTKPNNLCLSSLPATKKVTQSSPRQYQLYHWHDVEHDRGAFFGPLDASYYRKGTYEEEEMDQS